jgi:anti-sigma28 factor (negative regulator of flagellin synthesis)
MEDIAMDEINFDRVSSPLTYGKIEQNTVNKPVVEPVKSDEGVTVSNNLNKLVELLSAGEPLVDESARVAEMKDKVQSGAYIVNIPLLSDSLMRSGILNSVGG